MSRRRADVGDTLKTAHTLGPWHTGANASSAPHHAICAGPHVLAVVHQFGYPAQIGKADFAVFKAKRRRRLRRGRSPRSDANARLMAAAPELLDALSVLLPKGWSTGEPAQTPTAFRLDHLPGVATARAAIGKATNHSPAPMVSGADGA